MKRTLVFLLAVAVSPLAACTIEERPAPRYAYVQEAPPVTYVQPQPPPEPYEAQPPPPSPGGYVWVKGHWSWTGRAYAWVGGHWAARPRPTADWFPGRWERRGPGWIWIEGGWRL